MKSFTYTSKGPRPSNQDFLQVVPTEGQGWLLCVADGVGGNNGGEFASRLAVESFVRAVFKNKYSLKSAIEYANEQVLSYARSDPNLEGMATTLTAVFIDSDRCSVRGVHAGDSRAYLLRGRGLKQLSIDHSEVAKYLREGKLTKEQALEYPRKHIIYNALGSHKNLIVDEFEHDLLKLDRIVLSTDGFYNVINKRMFRDCSLNHPDLNTFGDCLVDLVEEFGATDNYSIIITELV